MDLDDPAADAMAIAEPEAEVKRSAPPPAPSEQLESLDGLDPPYDVGIIGSRHGRKVVAVDTYMVIYTFQISIYYKLGPLLRHYIKKRFLLCRYALLTNPYHP